jgi:ABC-type hemin transport system substrate-binding protein
MTKPLEWEKLVAELESLALAARTSESAKALKSRVQEAMAEAESNSAPCGIIDRLDLLILALTESSRENVCTNTRCPHYDKKCKMR